MAISKAGLGNGFNIKHSDDRSDANRIIFNLLP